jgi:hypothetical protein
MHPIMASPDRRGWHVLQKSRSKQCPSAAQGIAAANAAVTKGVVALPVATSPINVNVIVTDLLSVGA